MVYIYATMNQNRSYLKNGKRLEPLLDNLFLEDKIVVMDEEFYLRFGYDFKTMRIITVGDNNLSEHLDVESYKNVKSVLNAPEFKNQTKDLYFMGNYNFLHQVVPYASAIVANIVDDNDVEQVGNIYFTKFDDHNFVNIKVKEISPKIMRVTNLRVAPYNVKEKQYVKIHKKQRK